MGDGNLMDTILIDLDLNEEPVDPATPSVVLNGVESTRLRIEERLRQLEAVTARERQRHQQNSLDSANRVSDEIQLNIADRGFVGGNNSADLVDSDAEKGKGCKRDRSHLVAKALEMEAEVKKKADKEGGSFYDCNICLELAKEPILTCCGHLFCWACFYQVSDVDSSSKECPVCKGEVSNSNIIPIYGNGDGVGVSETANGLRVPPRPKARRVESVRQQQASRGLLHVPVAEALRRIRMSIGDSSIDVEAQLGQPTEFGSRRQIRIRQVSRVLSESAASLNSLSSALNNAERLVEDLETVINSRFARVSPPPASTIDFGSRVIMRSPDPQPHNLPPESNVELNVVLPTLSSIDQNDPFITSVQDLVTPSVVRPPIPPPIAPRYTLRRRTVSRTSDGSRQDTRYTRRRRLN